MKKNIFLLFIVSCGFAWGQIFVTHITHGRPLNGTLFYKGDQINSGGNWFYNFEIGQDSWNQSNVGIGQNNDGTTGWNWDVAGYYENGSGSNKRVRRDIANYRFTNFGTYYVAGRARANSSDTFTYTDENGWNNDTNLTLSTTIGNASYFTVSELVAPTLGNVAPSPTTATSVDLNWTRWNSKNVIILRKTSPITTAPTDGTAYTNGNSIDGATVIKANNSGNSFTDTGLTVGTQYYYAFYSINNNYYSSAATSSVVAGTFYTVVSQTNPNSTANWKSNTDGTDVSPPGFTGDGYIFVVQSGHSYTTTAAWALTGSSTLRVDGTLTLSHALTIGTASNKIGNLIVNGIVNANVRNTIAHTSGSFTINNGGKYVLNHTSIGNPTNTFNGVESFNTGSTFEYANLGSGGFVSAITYHHLILSGSFTHNFPSTIVINGDLTISGATIGSNKTSQVVGGNLYVSSGQLSVSRDISTSSTLTINGNIEFSGGTIFLKNGGSTGGTHSLRAKGNLIHSGGGFNWNSDATDNTSITNIFVEKDFTISGTAAWGGWVNANSCSSGIFFDGNGINQTFSSSLAHDAGNIRNRFYYKTTAGPSGLNEAYTGSVAQTTVNGTCGSTPPTGYERWPTSGALLKNFTVNNTSSTGVTLRNAREINGVLTLTDGELITGACNATTNNAPLLTMAAGSSVSGGSNASYVKGVISKVGNTAFTFPVGGNGKYAPIYLSAPGTVTDQFTTCYNDANATGGTTKETGVRDVSTCEHWFLNRSAGSSAVNVSLNLNNDRCATQTCGQIVNLDDTVWRNRGSITPAVPNNSYVTSNPTTSFGTFTWASGVLPVNHTNSATGDETKIGFGTQATMSTDFPNNRTGGFIAFDTKSKGFVIPRVSNANRPTGAEGLLIYNTDSNCMQLFSSGAWKCIEPVCE